MEQPLHEADNKSAARMLFMLNPRGAYHRAEILGSERLPQSGGAVIVSNHGRLDLDAFILIRLVLRARGRLMRLMADHMWFRLPWFDRIFSIAGAVDGTRRNALTLLEQGQLVLAYPGGVREIMGSRFRREHIDWEGRRGFAYVAIEAGVPVIPVVGVGINSGLIFVSSGKLLGRLIYQGVLRLGPAYAEYRDPLTIGILPVPLPFGVAVSLPLPCKVTYFVGEPVYPPVEVQKNASLQAEEEFTQQVVDAMRSLILEHGRPLQAPNPGLEQTE